MAPTTTLRWANSMYIYINLYMIIYKWVFAHAISMSALCFFNRKKEKKNKRKFQKKKVFIYALHFFVSLTFCTYLKRLTSVPGLTEPFSRSAKILYSMYMYFYSYAYKYMSVICLLRPGFLSFFSHLSWGHKGHNFFEMCARVTLKMWLFSLESI